MIKNTGDFVLQSSIEMAFELFEANERTKDIKDKLKGTLDALPDLLYEVGIDGYVYDYHSPRAELLYRPVDEMIGKKISEIVETDISDVIMSAIMEADEKGFSFGRQFKMTVPAGVRWFEISVSRKSSAAAGSHFVILRRDITERKLIEEDLRIHQIELEMQNEELRKKQDELDALRFKYFDLYDLAPVSCITLNEEGEILEANLSSAVMLRVNRSDLINKVFTEIIYIDDQDIFYLYRKHLLEVRDACVTDPAQGNLPPDNQHPLVDLKMKRPNGEIFHVHLKGAAMQDTEGKLSLRIVVMAAE